MCVAQRHFEDALTLLQKTKDYINQFSASNGQNDHVMSEVQRKVTLLIPFFFLQYAKTFVKINIQKHPTFFKLNLT